jgi:2-dehydro-3-deoxyphosphogalactonate aldolase
MSSHVLLREHRPLPLVAILRGLAADEAVAIGEALVASGFGLLEVPLNRPEALQAIAALVFTLPPHVIVGGGTVLTMADVDAVHAAGGRLIVSPNSDAQVISHAVRLGMVCAPGVATPTEAFSALNAGAHALKIFPAESVGPSGLKAWRSVLPPATDIWPVGGITPQSMAAWYAAGATGFGIGSQLFVPGASAAEISARGREFMDAWNVLKR